MPEQSSIVCGGMEFYKMLHLEEQRSIGGVLTHLELQLERHQLNK